MTPPAVNAAPATLANVPVVMFSPKIAAILAIRPTCTGTSNAASAIGMGVAPMPAAVAAAALM